MSKKRTTEEFIKLANDIHKGKYDYSIAEYKNKEEKIDIICPIHGVFKQKASLHLKGSGCPKCSYIERGLSARKNKDIFVSEANRIHKNYYSYEKFVYVNSHTKGTILCPKHGEFQQTPNDHLQGKGCNLCKTSHLEECFKKYLADRNISFEYQKHFEWLGKLSLDFYLPDFKIAIECQGKQHFGKGGWVNNFDFEELYQRDITKNNLCLTNGVTVLYICDNLNDVNYDIPIYNNGTVFDSFEKMLITHGIISNNGWKNDFIEFYNSINDINNLKKNVEIELCDLELSNEKYVLPSDNLKKLNKYRKIGKKVIFIFEDEWLYRKDIVKSRIYNILKLTKTRLYARKCVAREITYNECRDFLNCNHIQGAIPSKYYFGLYYKSELVSVMTFGSLRRSLGSLPKDDCYELVRFCNKLDFEVIGGASKLFKIFIRNYSPKEIISYCDLRWSDGNLYRKLGFELLYQSRPNYFYVDMTHKKRENRFKYRKNVLVAAGFDKIKSERDIMLEIGKYRIYDCGNYVFKYVV